MPLDKLKVIHSSPVWLPQTQTWMYNQLRYLPEDLVECLVVCECTNNLDQFHVPNIHSLDQESRLRYYLDKGLRKLKFRNHLGFLVQVAKKTGADILHSHFGTIGWANIKVSKQIGMKHVVTFYGVDVNMLPTRYPRWMKRYQKLFSQANLFLCEGPHMAECLAQLGCPKEKIKVQHLGVQIENIPYRPRRWQPGEPLKILIAASFREKKGITYALEALGVIQHEVNIKVTIMGDASPDPPSQIEKKKILNTIEQTGLQSRVEMLGYQSHSKFFEEAYKNHIFLSPSVTASYGDTEGGAPVSMIELIATGMPVVSTSHCDIPEVVKYDRNDWLVQERDVEGLVDRITWLIDHPDEWLGMLDKGRKHVEVEFDAKHQAKKLLDIYQKLTKP